MSTKTSTKHSPAPWHIKKLGTNLYVEHEHGMICDMQLPPPPPTASASWIKERDTIQAYARLIAAAPDLLQACRCLWAGLRDAHREHIDDPHSPNELVSIYALWDGLKLLRDAIAKAEQGQTAQPE